MKFLSLFGDIANAASNAYGKYRDGKDRINLAKVEANIAKWKAKAQSYENDAQRTHNWEIEALRQSQYSWKDEFWTLVLGLLLLAPMLLAIIGTATGDPKFKDMIDAAWSAYASMPIVLQSLYPFVILASMGIRYKGKRKAADAVKKLGG